MYKILTNRLWAMAIAVASTLSAAATDVVTIASPGPGLLRMTPEAYIATRLKITGHINARDFKTLKAATMAVTQELDLSEAVIEEAPVEDGCYSPITSDWIVGKTPTHAYPANTMPVHAFTLVGDNSLYKWHYGSSSLTKIILPETIRGIDDAAFYKMTHLAELEVPRFSTSARSIDNAVYNYETTRLVGLPPMYKDRLVLPESVTSVADSVLYGATVRGMEIRGRAKVNFGRQGTFNCPYVITDNPADYEGVFGDNTDVTTAISEIVATDVAAGTLSRTVGDQGVRAADVRSLTVSGTINADDLSWLCGLKNLHFLDLAEATFTGAAFTIDGNSSLCSLQLPKGTYRLTINGCPYLGGLFAVPEGVTYVSCLNTPMITAVTLPSTVSEIKQGSFEGSLVEQADLSACTALTTLSAFSSCRRLRTLLLPPNLKTLYNAFAPIERITLPEGLEELSASGWNVTTLTLPATLQTLSVDYMMHLQTLDASKAAALTVVTGPSHCPLIETVDFSASPVKTYQGMVFGLLSDEAAETAEARSGASPRVVVTGSTAKGNIHSAVRTLRLPSTLEAFYNGLVGCVKMEELDLGHCQQLKKLGEMSDMKRLHTLRLPSDLEQIALIYNCPALAHIYLAADNAAPAFSNTPADGVLEGVALHVPIGSRGLYFADNQWSRCAEIEEYGHTVRTTTAINGVQLTGAGMYKAGEAATVSAPTVIPDGVENHVFSAWRIAGRDYTTATATFTPQAATVAEAIYTAGAPSPERGDMFVTLTAPAATEVSLWLYMRNGGTYTVYDDNGTKDASTSGSEMTLRLKPGVNRFSLACANDVVNLMFTGSDYDNKVKIDELRLKKPETLRGLTTTGLQAASLRPADYPNLSTLSIYSGDLSQIDLSACGTLTGLWITSSDLTDIDLSACPMLSYVDMSCCKLGSLDLSTQSHLETLYCEDNNIKTLKVHPDAPLKTINCDYNMLGFSQITQPLYKAIVRRNNDVGRDYMQYKGPEGLGIGDVLDLSQELAAPDGSPVEISISTGAEEVEGVDGRYSLRKNTTHTVTMTCAAMPELKIMGWFDVSATSGIGSLSLDGLKMVQGNGRISITGMTPDARLTLYDAAGALKGRSAGAEAEFGGLAAGVYIIKIADSQGRSATLKTSVF